MIIGLVGKPSVGKSTFFKACTLADVAIASYPFTTIKPNIGIAYVKIDCIDKEFGVQCNPREGFCIDGKRFVPFQLIDVAGLVPGASEGKGLGNQFLDDLTNADALIQIVDLSGETDIEGKPVKNKDYDVCKDIEFLEKELDLWYLGILKKAWRTFARTIQNTKTEFEKAVAKQFSGLKVNEEQVKKVVLKLKFNPEKPNEWTDEELLNFAHELRHISKPMIIAGNKCDTENAKSFLEKIKQKYPELKIIPCSADSELALKQASKQGLIKYIPGNSDFEIIKELNEKQKQALEKIRDNVLKIYGNTGIQQILNYTVFDLLKYITVFPAGLNKLTDSKGNTLPDCFLVPPNTTALEFAFRLHTDIGNSFVKAINVKTKKPIGKDYVIQNRDAIEIATR